MADLNEPKKETVQITSPPPAEPVEKEPARINLPNRPPPASAAQPPGNNPSTAPTVPALPPPPAVAPKPLPATGGAPAKRPPALTPSNPPPFPPGLRPTPSPESVQAKAPPPPPGASSLGPAPANRGPQVGPRKETARIAMTPGSPMKATVKLNPIQPLSVPSAGMIRAAPPPAVANLPAAGLVESVPPQLCWALLGISALILLIQLWTYFA